MTEPILQTPASEDAGAAGPHAVSERDIIRNLLKYIKKATAGADGKGIPIYVDPIGLHEGEMSLTSTIQIDVEGVPLRTTLHLCLKQLGLTYEVKDGYLMITSDFSGDVLLVSEDPFLIVGHCLLALLAAVFGGAAAPLIAGRRERI